MQPESGCALPECGQGASGAQNGAAARAAAAVEAAAAAVNAAGATAAEERAADRQYMRRVLAAAGAAEVRPLPDLSLIHI